MDEGVDRPSPKRKRLSHACNYCRHKKTRCDEQHPSCRNCRIAGVECITTDKRRAGVVVANRRRAGEDTPTPPVLPGVGQTPESRPSLGPAATSHHQPRSWPQCWDKSGWKSGRLPMMPRFVGGSMFELMTEWLDLAFYRLKIPPCYNISVHGKGLFLIGKERNSTLPPPSADDMEEYVARYRQGLHRLFPFLSEGQVDSASEDMGMLYRSDVPKQALRLLIATVGLMSTPADASNDPITAYIHSCNDLLGHLVASRCLESVQAVFLFAIVLRSCDQIAWAWDILSLAVSMAQSIGINQRNRAGENLTNSHSQAHQTWWCMYVFENILAFESGRPSMILDRELSSPNALSDAGGHSYQRACVSLANLLREIQERSARTWKREEWQPQTVDEAIEEKLNTGGELGMLVEEWQQSLPTEYQSRSSVASDLDNAPRSAFLSFYYYYANIMLNRSTLLIEKSELEDVVKRFGLGKPWQHRVANGGTICAEAARDMIKLLVNLVDSNIPTYLTVMMSPLVATYALAMHVLRERSSLLIRSDFELMKAGMELTKQHYRKHGMSEEIEDVLRALEQYVAQCLDGRLPDLITANKTSLDLRLTPGESPAESSGNMVLPLDMEWGPSALDWAGWDWNDLSHLFEHGE